MGAWFEAIVVKVAKDEATNELCYKVQFEE